MSIEDLPQDKLLDVARLNEALLNGDTREEYLRLVKKANPTLKIPELDQRDHTANALKAERDAREALEARIRESEIRQNLENARKSVKDKHKLSDDDITQVEKLMTERQIPSYDTAAEFFAMSRRVATPTSASVARPSVDLPDASVWGKGLGNKAALDKIAREVAYQAFNDVAKA